MGNITKLEYFKEMVKEEEPRESETEKVIGSIREYLESVPFGSTEHMAFSDCVDLGYTEVRFRRTISEGPRGGERNIRGLENEISLIGETIRRRQNELPGYLKAFWHTRRMSDRLIEALRKEGKIEDNPLAVAYSNMHSLKREYIEKFNE